MRAQRGNADDVLIRRLHGPSWRERADAPRGRFRRHAAVTAAGVVGLAGGVLRAGIALRNIHGSSQNLPGGQVRRVAGLLGLDGGQVRRVAGLVGLAGAVAWAVGIGEFARARIKPGPRTADEVLGVLFDRDGTLVHDVPYNGDPELVKPVDGAAEALAWLRERGVPVGVVTNQSAVGRGMITLADVAAVNARVAELLGPFDDWQVCPHVPADGCGCRKPRPGMVLAAAEALGVPADRLVVIGDIGADVGAAHAAGARAVLVPTPTTRPEEIDAAPAVAPDLLAAVRLAVEGGAR